jgi:peptidoglycan hydrolase-like protein with peptidoglycan-binding domain
VSFLTGTQAELLYTLPAAVTKNTYTTEAVFSALAATAPLPTIPGGYFGSVPNGVGRGLYLHAEGTIATTSAATFAVNLGLDSVAGTKANAVAVMAATAPVAAITAPWHLDVYYTCQAVGTTGGMTLQVNGQWYMCGSASGGAAVATGLSVGFAGTLTGLLDTTQYYIELFGTWSASAAGNTTTLHQLMLFGLN